jgi:predicted pyridoxine 5'-phosphate oxidase superfamily flavin-nucleotide-binding protein
MSTFSLVLSPEPSYTDDALLNAVATTCEANNSDVALPVSVVLVDRETGKEVVMKAKIVMDVENIMQVTEPIRLERECKNPNTEYVWYRMK